MEGDRRWMYNRVVNHEVTSEYIDGVKNFIQFAFSRPDNLKKRCHDSNEDCIMCPCVVCQNSRVMNESEVGQHLLQKGFRPDYFVWENHGEKKRRTELGDAERDVREDDMHDTNGNGCSSRRCEFRGGNA